MKRIGVVAVALLAAACGSSPRTPHAAGPGVLAARVAQAQSIELQKSPAEALDAMLDVLDLAVDSSGGPGALEAASAALDAIVTRRVLGMEQASNRHALAFRVKGGPQAALARLQAAWERAPSGSFIRPMLAAAATSLTMVAGDSAKARSWRERSGCVRKATVLGPLDWAALGPLQHPLELETPGKPLPAASPGIPPFGVEVRPAVAEADGCELETDLVSSGVGLRAVVVDVENARPQRLWLSVTTTSAAEVSVAGQPLLHRGFDAGGGRVTRIGSIHAAAGRVRVVVRLGQRDDGNRIALSIAGDDGLAVATRAPAPGDAAPATASRGAAVWIHPSGASSDELVLASAALLAMGDGRATEKLVETQARDKEAAALVVMQYARSLTVGSALPEVRRIERQREAFDRALSKMPSWWEPAVGAATLAGQRKGMSEGRVEALSELQKLRERGLPAHPMLEVYEAAVASATGMFDRGEQALRRSPAQAPITRDAEGLVRRKAGKDLIAWSCADTADRDSFACYEAHVSAGDPAGALGEVQRLRALHDSPGAYREAELSQVLVMGDGARALSIYDALAPTRRSASALGMIARSKPEAARQRLARDLPDLADGPDGALSLRQVLMAGQDGTWDELGSKLVAEDRAKPAMPEAATLVIEHREQYTIGKRGVLMYTLYDLRRVAGTTDVDQGAQATGALVEGREAHRVLRRRIHKGKDGRVLEPDQAAQASQEHSDLSQLEQGDYVEQLVTGVALPGNMGQLVVDTPDLLPARTSVLHAAVEVRYPAGLKLARWAHGTLQGGQQRADGDQQVWSLELSRHGPRRLEAGVPKMEQEVNVSFGTQTWGALARGMGEVVSALQAQDPQVRAFSKAAVGEETAAPKQLDKLVAAIGKKVKISSSASLSDSAAALASGTQETSARTILELSQGSRSWIAYQALSDLKIPAELLVAESEPFASDPAFPAHAGRFDHPLLIVHLPGAGDRWLDLDVSGPPLPAGKVSPELRGRTAMRVSGEMMKVPAGAETGPDEVDVRIAVDERGDAKGTVTMLLRGRAAQVLLDAFEDRAGADRKDMLRSVVLGWIPWANVDDVAMSSAEGSWELGVRASVTIPGFAQPEGSTWVLSGMTPLHAVVPQPVSATIASTFAGQGGRENALAIDNAWHYHLHRRIELPQGWSVQRSPGAFQMQDPHIQADRKIEVNAAVVEENFELSIPTGTVAAAEFDEFADKARKVDDAFLASIRVVKAKGSKK